jgi:hypothetical protein
MAGETMSLISTITVGSGGATGIDFTSIPQTFTDLLLVTSLRSAFGSAYQDVPIYFNNNGSGYSMKKLFGNGSSSGTGTTSGSGAIAAVLCNAATSTSNSFSNCSIYISNYTGSTNKFYSIDSVYENNGATAFQEIQTGLWSNTSAINQIAVSGAGQTFVQYSTVSLYGILKGSGGATVS